MMTALLLIDLQNDFLSLDGAMYHDNFLAKDPNLQGNIEAAISHLRSLGCPIIWIRSEYPATESPLLWPNRPHGLRYASAPMPEEYLASSHRGKRIMCAPGSLGASLYPSFEKVRSDEDAVFEKQYFSAFSNTDVAEHLRKNGITTVIIAGVSANNFVLATATHAFFNEFEVYVLASCVGASSEDLHQKAMGRIAKHYGRVVFDLEKIPMESRSIAPSCEDEKTLYYVNGSIPSWRVMMMLSELNIQYTPVRLKVMTKPKETRSVAFSRINPRCKTPTLIDDGKTLIESMAILQYLERKYGHTASNDDTWITTLTRFHESENAHYVFEDIELCFEADLSSAEQDRVAAAVNNTLAEMAYWEAYVSTQDYVAGEGFSIADCAFYPCIAYLEHRGWGFEGFPALKRYADRVRERKCAGEACPDGWAKKGKKDLWKRAVEIKEAREKE